MEPCTEEHCLLRDTPAVGIFPLPAKSMSESLLGKTERGQKYRLGRGKVTMGNVKAAFDLLEREFPQVSPNGSIHGMIK